MTRINNYPQTFRLVGDRTPSRLHLPLPQGTFNRAFLHAINWTGVVQDIDLRRAELPPEEKVMAQNPLTRKYLSFTIYNLLQMTTAGTISPEIAWTLFNMEWNGIKREPVCHESFAQRRAEFFSNLQAGLSLPKAPTDLLAFEFWARAGQAGLKQIERYFPWAGDMLFVRKNFRQLGEGIKDEYRKALWLEMRILEDQLGLGGLNKDIGRMILLKDGAYFFKKRRTIGLVISLKSPEPIESTIKAEMGHWMFELLSFREAWVEELMDRMNMSNFTAAVAEGLEINDPEKRSPMARTFIEGGAFLASRGVELEEKDASHPLYPADFPVSRLNTREPHEIAELFETMIRRRIVKAAVNKDILAIMMFPLYRKIGLYIALLSLEGNGKKEIANRVWALNLEEINDYYQNFRERALAALEARSSRGSDRIIYMANRALKHFNGPIGASAGPVI
jgi:hypothetical protein